MPLGDLQSLERSILTGLSAGVGQQMCFVEICCSEKSALREACRVAKMPYAAMECLQMFRIVVWLERSNSLLKLREANFAGSMCARPLSISLTVLSLVQVT